MNVRSFFFLAFITWAVNLPLAAAPVGDAFTYQGRLNQSGSPVSAPQDFEFGLYDGLSTGSQVGTTNTLANVAVVNGLFNVPLNFGTGAFGSEARYLQIRVRPTVGGSGFTGLAPRLPILPSPLAQTALSVAAGGVNNAALADGSVTREKLDPSFNSNLSLTTTFHQFFTSDPDPTKYPTFYFETVFSPEIFPIANGVAVNKAGVYLISTRLKFDIPFSQPFTVDFMVNNVQLSNLYSAAIASGITTVSGTEIINLNAGDSLTIRIARPEIFYQLVGDQMKSTVLNIVRLD